MQSLNFRAKFLAAIAVAALATLPSQAQEARQLLSGSTSLAVDSGLVTALTGFGVTLSANAPATLTDTTAVFPVVSGGVDQDTLVGVVYHSGGLTFTSTADKIAVTVSQLALVNGIAGQPAQLYGLVIVNGKTFGLYPLFNLGASISLPLSGSVVNLPNIKLTLSSQGAALLNQAFGFNGFSTGETIGVATLQASATSYIVPRSEPIQ
jgi:hypothetical protein